MEQLRNIEGFPKGSFPPVSMLLYTADLAALNHRFLAGFICQSWCDIRLGFGPLGTISTSFSSTPTSSPGFGLEHCVAKVVSTAFRCPLAAEEGGDDCQGRVIFDVRLCFLK